jgi:hypothetical protein
VLAADETNAAERPASSQVDVHAKRAEAFDAVGHEPFAAGFIDGRMSMVDDCDGQALAPQGDRSGKTGGPAADDKHVSG